MLNRMHVHSQMHAIHTCAHSSTHACICIKVCTCVLVTPEFLHQGMWCAHRYEQQTEREGNVRVSILFPQIRLVPVKYSVEFNVKWGLPVSVTVPGGQGSLILCVCSSDT